MKIRKLFLSAFGPFTGRVLDFAATPARLHLVYGPNEAGKSSALRAMGDLRFGIPLRSVDNFVHDHAQMLLAGEFDLVGGAAADGTTITTIAMARRKRNKDALTAADPATGAPLLQVPISTAVQQALTGGVDRARYELSFGLDHARLREGGRQLVQGEGELGAALFEASAGLQGVKALLAALQEDAKAYYGPRSAQAVINDAARQLEEHKHALKKALVRPDAWRDRQRVLDAAGEQLKALQAEMTTLRQRAATLAELRAVQPLLQQLDQAGASVERLGPVPPLPADAREQRLAASQSAQAAQNQRADAQAELDACAEAQAGLTLAPRLLAHAAAIDRLAQDFDAMRRQRAEGLQARALVAVSTEALAEQASRMAAGQSAAALGLAAPTPAERLALDELLAEGACLAQALGDAHDRVARTEAQMQAGAAPSTEPAAPDVLAALDAALQQAHGLGEGVARQTALRHEVATLAHRLAQALVELGVAAATPLQVARPLLAAEITQAEQAMAALGHEAQTQRKEEAQLQQALQTQLLRREQLAAEGELVTAQTLQAARQRRDVLWQQVKHGRGALKPVAPAAQNALLFDDEPASPADLPAVLPAASSATATAALPAGSSVASPASPAATAEAFERAQSETDRQADLLREGAERAAQAAECRLRIDENQAARQSLLQAQSGLAARLAQTAADWQATLAAAGLPTLSPPVLRDWQDRRAAALALWQQHASAEREEAELTRALDAAQAALRLAMQRAGQAPASESALAPLAQQARAWLQQQLEAAAHAQALAAQQRQWRVEHAAAMRDAAARAEECAANAAAQAGWAARLWLPAGSSPGVIKARLAEFAALAQSQAEQRAHQATVDKLQALEDALAPDAGALAALLQEPAVAHLGDFVDQLQRRRAQAEASALQAVELQRRAATARRQLDQAETQAAASAAVLQHLGRLAGVAEVSELAEAEQRAAEGRHLQVDVLRLTAQLEAASSRPIAELRLGVADLDVAGTDAERARIEAALAPLQARIDQAVTAQMAARQAFEAIDTSGAAADAREAMESAAARYRAALQPWAQLKMAESLLQEALRRFREKAQGPMVTLASEYFALITGGRYVRLRVEEVSERPALQAVDADGRAIGIEAMSEGTADQLYLALRLAALELQRSPERAMPLVLDDVLMTSDDVRAVQMFRALARFAEGGQVLLFTHHQHLVPLAQAVLPADMLAVHSL